MQSWLLSSWEPKDVATAAISLAALAAAIWANVRNYRLTRRISEMPGRLRRFQIVTSAEEEGGDFSLVVANGPSDTVLTDVALECSYVASPLGRLTGSTTVTFFIHRRDFSWFGMFGPSLPCRIAPHDQRVWTFSVDRGLLDIRQDLAHSATFRFIGTTALGHRYVSNQLHVGVVSKTLLLNRSYKYLGSVSENLATLERMHPDVHRWLQATRAAARALDSDATAEPPRRGSSGWRSLFSRRTR